MAMRSRAHRHLRQTEADFAGMAVPRPALHMAVDVVHVSWHGYDPPLIILTDSRYLGVWFCVH
jgi:hypothetical protein